MQKTIQFLILMLAAPVILAAIPQSLYAQTTLKGWLVEYQEDWIHAPFGYQRFRIKIATNPPSPVKDTIEFRVVVKQLQNGTEHAVNVTPMVIEEGDTSAEVEVLVNQSNNTYNGYMYVHVERDGNLSYDPNRDLFNFYSSVSGNNIQSAGMPTILFISSAVTNKVTKRIRVKRNLVNVPGSDVFTIDDAKFPSVNVLYRIYPDVNGQPVGMTNAAKKNPTALDVMESPWLHAIEPTSVPRNWLALTSAELVVVSYEDLVQVAKDPTQIESIRKWVAAGGSLVVNNAGAKYEQAPKIRALVDGQSSLSARRKNPWTLPSSKVRKLKKFVVQENDPNNYYYGGNQPEENFKTKNGMRINRKHWPTIDESDDLGTAIDNAKCKFAFYKYLLGRVIVVGDDMFTWKSDDWKQLLNTAVTEDRTIRERFGSNNAAVPADNFAIQGVGKPPVKEFQYLIGLFVLAIGPVSYIVLKRQRRLQLLFLTVPAISLVACTGLLLYALLSDGFQNRGRMRSFTAMDHSRQRAVSFVRHSHYAGVQPNDYRFQDDEVVFNGRAWSSPRSILIHNSRGVSLNGGDIRPRMPHQIVSVRNYDTAQRLALIPAGTLGEPPRVQNQFDNPIRFAILRTKAGYFSVENVAAGDTAATQEILLKDGQSLGRTAAGRKLISLLEEISPKVTDDFFSRSAYANDPFSGYYQPSVTDKPASIECDHRLRALRSKLDKFFPKPGQYVAILEEFSSIPPPQPNIEYKNKLHVIHGIW